MTRKCKGPGKNWGIKGVAWRKKRLETSLKVRRQKDFMAPNRRLSLFPEFTCNTFLIHQFPIKGTRAESKWIGYESPSF